MPATVPIQTPCGVIEMPLDGSPVDCQGRPVDRLAHRVAARWLRATDSLVAEPGTTYVYQVDANNEVLYPGERVLVRVGDELVRGEVIEEVRMEPHTYLVCPHCRQDIHEKGLYYNGSNYFHSSPTCRDKPMRMPPPKPEDLAALG